MKRLAAIALATLCACSPAGSGDNPRDRKGAEGKLTWRIVAEGGGHAAFLSRPGAAPDLVLWCRDNGLLTLRAHIFEDPKAQPDLRFFTLGGAIAFDKVRRQGGVRAGDRKLVEGSVPSSDPKLVPVLLAAANFKVTSSGVDYDVTDSDPTNILPQFATACAAQPISSKAKP
jgi:hypothetical protein